MVREELVIFIQPRIVHGKGQLRDLQQLNAQKSQLVRDIQSQATILPPKYADPEDQKGYSKAQLALPWYFQKKPSAGTQSQTNATPAPPEKNKNRFRGRRR